METPRHLHQYLDTAHTHQLHFQESPLDPQLLSHTSHMCLLNGYQETIKLSQLSSRENSGLVLPSEGGFQLNPTFIPYPVGAREEQDTGSSALAKGPEEAQPRQTKTDGTDCHLQTQHKGGTPTFVSKKLFKLYSSVGMRILN